MRLLARTKIRTKLLAGFGVLMTLLLGMGASPSTG